MEFKGKITDLTRDYKTGNAKITIETSDHVLKEAEELAEKELSCKLSIFRKKRSKDANAYFWVLADKLAKKLGTSKVEIYREYIKDVSDNYHFLVLQTEAAEAFCKDWEHNGLGWLTDSFPNSREGFTNVMAYYGSSQYNTEQMSRLIKLVVHDCEENNITTLTPKEIALMLDDWRNKNEQVDNAN